MVVFIICSSVCNINYSRPYNVSAFALNLVLVNKDATPFSNFQPIST